MKVIAITGGIGSGKSICLREFGSLGAHIISCDEISHRIMMRGGSAYGEVVERFGREILKQDGEIDRAALGKIVFSDKTKLETLNSITHRLIFDEVKKQTEETSAAVVCIEIPLLFTTESPIDIDLKLAVVAPKELKIQRVMERDDISREQIEARMANQLSDEEMRERADCVIENDGDINALREKVANIFAQMIEKAGRG